MVELYKLAKEFHKRVVEEDAALTRWLASNTSREDHADMAYAIRETTNFMEDARKKLFHVSELAQKLACIISVHIGQADSFRTEHCTATPDPKTFISIPRRSTHPEQYAKLMEHLKIPRELWDVSEEDHAVVKPHWPGLVDYIARQLQEGLPLPGGVDPNKTWVEYKLRLLKKKEVS
jgi:hypothetical protein